MYTDSEMSLSAKRIYAVTEVHFKEVRSFLFIHSERTPLLPVALWTDTVFPHAGSIMSHEQFKPIGIRANLLVNYKT